ncbi:hypothetical protein GWN26_07945, partial [Candidatus Saccharibacteria bacterium]|nr:hypothetical protein [Calditrichia bacterium]NIV71913.1 hypothetical protein [Calditrichia bacterium]NIV99075.1 hypothetical protein [Candidatus Saccharibacteria bacterium]NIW78700.1 hypothetical protein [Calditrichia bacterium]
MSSPQIDTRKFSELLKQAEALAPFYTPEWRAGQTQDPGQTLLRIFLHLQEQVLARLNQAPDKNFVAFLDMLGIKLLSAQPAEAAVTFTLTRGATQPVLAPKKTLLSGKAADGSGEVIFQTKEDLLVVPAALKQVLSFNVSQDKLVRHTKDDEENDLQPFSLFDGTNQQERSLYIGHEELFNQETPSEIKINFTLSKFSNGSEKLALVWEYSDGVRWLPFARFPRQATTTTGTASSQTGKNKVDEDQTDLFAKSGEMILIKGQTGEIAQTKVNDIKNRWIRCRLTEKLNTQSSVILPEINTIRLSVNPIDPFAPELAFNNDIPLKLEEISVKMLALEGVPMEFEIFPKRGEKKIYVKVNLGELELFEGDFLKLDNRYDGAEIREIVKIEGDNGDEITLNEVLGFDYDVTATL